jgi:NAD(P)-dependent dehydrogenase (short-subunit alcohol dehydrogenase family)
MSGSLSERVAIVTGAGRGIGRATALLLAAHGARVVVNDLGASLEGEGRDDSPADLVAREIRSAGGEAIPNGDSVAEWESAQRIVEAALDQWGRIDLLVNNAGLGTGAAVWDQDPEVFDRVVRSHLHGTFHCLRAAAPHMKAAGYGRVVNVVSRAGLLGVPNQVAYAAGKGGVFGITNVASRDLAPYGVTVNAVNPAATETRMVTTAIEAFRSEGGASAKMAEGLAAALQPPEHIAALITALCHEEAGRFNGEIFYLEKERLGLFEPLGVGQDAKHAGGWTVEAILPALAAMQPHSMGVIYTDD